MQYSDDGLGLTINIVPTLTPKSATFQRDVNSTLYYKGDDPGYLFEVETGYGNQVKRASVIITDRNLELRFF